jgi:hypothetical protein
MNARLIRTVVGGLTLAASGTYTFVYLYRWEWNRALMSAAIFVAAEVAIMGSVLAERLKAINKRLDAQDDAAQRQRLDRIRETAPPARANFDWLARPQQMNVFVPVLMGAGVLMSGLAWVVERVARTTVGPAAEKGLATQLDSLALPASGFLAGHDEPVDLLRGPVRRLR